MPRRVHPVPEVVHRPSHRALLTPLPLVNQIGAGFDGVLVPSVRGADHLVAAAALAEAERCGLIVMCSGETTHGAAWWRMTSCGGAAVDWPAFAREVIPSLRTPAQAPPTARPYAETAAKRNFSLILARLMGWDRVVFMDDDMTPPPSSQLRRAAAALTDGGVQAVSWTVDYPDNSVVCHALRLAGERQDTFVGSGMLALDVRGPLPFFPPVYNEDWLFLFDLLAQGKVAYGGSDVRQREHDPFANPARADAQEFGDVLGEGLFELLHLGRAVDLACFPPYWDAVIAGRGHLLDRIERRLLDIGCHSRESRDVDRELESLDRSRAALAAVTAQALAAFVAAWRHDLRVWNDFLAQLPRLGSLAEALCWLGLPEHHVVDAELAAELPA